MQINVRGAQVRPAQTRQDTSKLQDIQRRAQDTQALIGIAQSAVSMFSNMSEEADRKKASAKAGEIDVWKETTQKEELKAASTQAIDDANMVAERGVHPDPLQGPLTMGNVSVTPISNTGIEKIDNEIGTINKIHADNAKTVYESAFDGTLISNSFNKIPEDMQDLPAKTRFANSQFKANLENFYDSDAAEDAHKNALAQFIAQESEFVNGQDILDYDGDYLNEMRKATADLEPLARGRVLDNFNRAVTNAIAESPDRFALMYAESDPEKKLRLDSYLDNSLLDNMSKTSARLKVNNFEALDELFSTPGFDPTSFSGNLKLFEAGGVDTRQYMAEMNRRVLADGTVSDGEQLLRFADGTVPMDEQTQFVAQQTGALSALPPGTTISMGSSGSGRVATGAEQDWKTITSDKADESGKESANAMRQSLFTYLLGGDFDAEVAKSSLAVDFDRFIADTFGMPGTHFANNPSDPLDLATMDKHIKSLADHGMTVVPGPNGRGLIRFDSMRIMDRQQVIDTALDSMVSEGIIGAGEWRVEPPASPGGGYMITDISGQNMNITREGNFQKYTEFVRLITGQPRDEKSSQEQEADVILNQIDPNMTVEELATDLGWNFVPDAAVESLLETEFFKTYSEGYGEEEALGLAEDVLRGTELVGGVASVAGTLKLVDVSNGFGKLSNVGDMLSRHAGGNAIQGRIALEKIAKQVIPNFSIDEVRDLARQRISVNTPDNRKGYAIQKKMAEIIADQIKGVDGYDKKIRNIARGDTLRALREGAKEGIKKGAAWAAGGLWSGMKNLGKELLNPVNYLKAFAGRIAMGVVDYKNLQMHGMTTEEVMTTLAAEVGMERYDATTRLLNSYYNAQMYKEGLEGPRAYEGEGVGDFRDRSGLDIGADIVRATLDNTLFAASNFWFGTRTSSNDLEAVLRGTTELVLDAGRAMISHIGESDTFSGNKRTESNNIKASERAERVIDSIGIPQSWGGVMHQFQSDNALIRRARADVHELVRLQEGGVLIDSAVFNAVQGSDGFDIGGLEQDMERARADATKAITALELDPNQLPSNTRAMPQGSTRIYAEDYTAVVDHLQDVAMADRGEFDMDPEQAEELLATLTASAGTDIVNLNRITREFYELGTYKDATPLLQRIDLDDPSIESYVTAFDRWLENRVPTPNDRPVPRDRKQAYLQWVGRGMPLFTGESTLEITDGKTFTSKNFAYPLNPKVDEALGMFTGNDYMHLGSVHFDEDSNRVALRMKVQDDMFPFLAYMDSEGVRPSNPIEMRQAYEDFRAFDAYSQTLENLPEEELPPIGDVVAKKEQIAERTQTTREAFMANWPAYQETYELSRHTPYAPAPISTEKAWSTRFAEGARQELKRSTEGHTDWPVRYADTPERAIWDLPTDDPVATRKQMEEDVQYLNSKIELETDRMVTKDGYAVANYAGINNRIRRMQAAIRSLRNLQAQTYLYESEVQAVGEAFDLPRKFMQPTAASLSLRWSPYIQRKARELNADAESN